MYVLANLRESEEVGAIQDYELATGQRVLAVQDLDVHPADLDESAVNRLRDLEQRLRRLSCDSAV